MEGLILGILRDINNKVHNVTFHNIQLYLICNLTLRFERHTLWDFTSFLPGVRNFKSLFVLRRFEVFRKFRNLGKLLCIDRCFCSCFFYCFTCGYESQRSILILEPSSHSSSPGPPRKVKHSSKVPSLTLAQKHLHQPANHEVVNKLSGISPFGGACSL